MLRARGPPFRCETPPSCMASPARPKSRQPRADMDETVAIPKERFMNGSLSLVPLVACVSLSGCFVDIPRFDPLPDGAPGSFTIGVLPPQFVRVGTTGDVEI